ncbi:MAG: patatin-like phospholipase family protein [Frankiaceae bacterium]
MPVPKASARAGSSAECSAAVTEPPVTKPPLSRLTAVYGGGGLFGIAYGLGVADALLNAGVPLRGAESLGTSAGSWVASCLATNTGFDQLCALPPIRVPNRSSGLLRGLAGELFGESRSDLVRACAVRVPSGRPVLLSGAEHALADVVAASSAVPLLFPPARIGRRFFADGGVRSLVHADRAVPAQHLLVVAPIAGPMFAAAGRAMEAMLRREMRRWQQRTGGVVHLIRPNRRIAALARHPLDLFDKDRATEAYPLAYLQAARLAMTSPGLAQLAASPRPAGMAAVRKRPAASARRELATAPAG